MKKTDAHFHVNLNRFSVEKIISYLDEKKIDRCWLLTWEEKQAPIPSLYQHLPVEDVLEAYEKYPDRFVPFYAPDPGTEELKARMEEFVKKGIKGCGELKVTYKWEDIVMERYLDAVASVGIPLLFHMEAPRRHYVPTGNSSMEKWLEQLFNGAMNGVSKYYLTRISKMLPPLARRMEKGLHDFPGYLYDFAALENLLQQYPQVIFLGHGPHFWNHIAFVQSEKHTHQRGKIKQFGIIDRLLEQYDNFYCDISGKSGYNALTRDPEKAKTFLEKHHSKLLFGTDNTGYDFDAMLASYRLPVDKMQNIYHKNAGKIIP